MNATARLSVIAASLLTAAPIAASAAQTSYAVTPISIAAVSDTQNDFAIPFGPQRLYVDALTVGFVNRTNVAATNVEFAVTRADRTLIVREHGSYAPGTRVDLDLSRETTTLPSEAAHVAIAKVDFADGSSWTPAAGTVASR